VKSRKGVWVAPQEKKMCVRIIMVLPIITNNAKEVGRSYRRTKILKNWENSSRPHSKYSV